MDAPARRAFVAAALLAGCSPPPPVVVGLPPPVPVADVPGPSSAAPRAPAPAPKVAPRGPYVGLHVGLMLPEIARFAKLPADLTLLAGLELGVRPDAAQILTARKEEDLLMLLTNKDGVVIDVVEVPGVAQGFALISACRAADDSFADAALMPNGCTANVVVRRAWNVRAGKIVPFTKPVTCTCIAP